MKCWHRKSAVLRARGDLRFSAFPDFIPYLLKVKELAT